MVRSSSVDPTAAEPRLGRRTFCRGLFAAGIATLAFPAVAQSATREKALAFRHLHTEERLKAVFWRDGRYDSGALADINHVLRDHYSGDVAEIDPDLLDFLHDISAAVDAREPFHVISGYRSPATNAMLRKKGRGVGKKSQHMKGKAIDVRIPGVALDDLRRVARAAKRGGVGYYPRSNFVHLDTGRVRFW